MVSVGPERDQTIVASTVCEAIDGLATPPSPIADCPGRRRPRHIAIIMDGNGRWARRQDLPRVAGPSARRRFGPPHHRRSVPGSGIEQLTLYCLSSENWKRPQTEINFLMTLLEQYMIAERATIMDNNMRVRMLGRRDDIPDQVLAELDKTVAMSQANTGTLAQPGDQLRRPSRTGRRDAERSPAKSRPASSRPRRIGEQTIAAAALHGRRPGPRPVDPHRRRNADQQFPVVADQLRRDLGDRQVLAGVRRGRRCTRRSAPTRPANGAFGGLNQ